MVCDGWAWSPGNISTRKKQYMQVLLFSTQLRVFVFPCPLCNMHVLTKGRIQSQQYIYFFSVHVRLGLHRHKIFHLQCTNFCAECYEYVVPKPSIMKFSNSYYLVPAIACLQLIVFERDVLMAVMGQSHNQISFGL